MASEKVSMLHKNTENRLQDARNSYKMVTMRDLEESEVNAKAGHEEA